MKPAGLVIINPAAGALHASHVRRDIARRIAAITDSTVVETSGPGHAQELAREHAPRVDRIVVVGGDGTANEAANGILESACPERPIALVPLGTGNDFARALGHTDPDVALRAISDGRVRSVDVLSVDRLVQHESAPARRYALIYVGIGFPADVVEAVGPWTKKLLGSKRCYTFGSLVAILRRRVFEAALSGEGLERTGAFNMIWVSNIAELAGKTMHLSPGANFDDGRMEIGALDAVGRLTLLRTLSGILSGGTHVGMQHVRYTSGTDLRVNTPVPQPMIIDGELWGRSPYRVSVGTTRLHVVVPSPMTT